MITRREFTVSAAATAAGLALSTTAKSYARIIGANERVNVAVIGNNSRAGAHLSSLHANKEMVNITHIADVETNIMAKFAARVEKQMGTAPKCHQDFRQILTSPDVDAITIATPDHWHTPIAILGMQAGKAVYVEKPCSQNVHEAELIVAAQKKYKNKIVQMGNQQRSSQHSIDIINKVQSGNLIGRAYYTKAWYTNNRKGIGVGKPAPVPATLDWDLWQGPAPKQAYKDNVQPYNWHWFKTWGTGEALNNGTHEVDVARWSLGVAMPNRISAFGGRYAYKDDWQFYDTLNVSFEYGDNKLISWECRCCNDMPIYNRERGIAVYGETGAVILDRDGWEVHDLKGKMLDQFSVKTGKSSSTDLVGADAMTDVHFKNFLTAVKGGSQSDLNSPVAEGAVAVKMLLMTNIAYDLKRPLDVDPSTGNFINDAQATAMRKRTYDPKFEPKLI